MSSLRIPVEHDNADIQNSADFLANVNPPIRIRCGDHVLHRPSGETWVVAYADYGNGDLSACGWPDSVAKISDCDVIKIATDEEHLKWLGDLIKHGDRRGKIAKHLYCLDMNPKPPLASQEGAHPIDKLVTENERYYKQWEAQKFGNQEGGEVCKSCKGSGAVADYIGYDMKCVGVECTACHGSGFITPAAPAEAVRVADERAADMPRRGL